MPQSPTLPSVADVAPPLPVYAEVQGGGELQDASSIAERLRAIDWAFAADATNYLTHDLHPYPAKFIPQLPGQLIALLSLRGDLVLDPFGGSGTTALEALRLGRRCVCTDANPVGLLVGRAKTSVLSASDRRELKALRSFISSAKSSGVNHQRVLNEASAFIPDIPNRRKWFSDIACAELALIRSRIAQLPDDHVHGVASLPLSRIILRASNQDSETRYTSREKDIQPGAVLAMYLQALDQVVDDIVATAPSIRYGVASFLHADFRNCPQKLIPDESIDAIVTSPPYGNAMDYHLYHRFRLYWLGFEPKDLAQVEIGSHLRHQRERNGFDAYRSEMLLCTKQMHRVLRPGRYAAFVIGDSIYEGRHYSGGAMIEELGQECGFEHTCTVERSIHATKRSFTKAGRRATTESIVVLRKPDRPQRLRIIPTNYRLWAYEESLAERELQHVIAAGVRRVAPDAVEVRAAHAPLLRSLTFVRGFENDSGYLDRTWQASLENGWADPVGVRKEAKYVTHGLHPYKGKFYPQLARSLMMIAGARPGQAVLDPFCGSGTTLLEAHLNGLAAFGCDLHPLAAKIASAKLGILEVDPDAFDDAVETLLEELDRAPQRFPSTTAQFAPAAVDEILSWFAAPVVYKMEWLLGRIRSVSSGIIREFFEVIFSSIIRDISQQDPSDLRIRRRKDPLQDADVLAMFGMALREQVARVRKYWSIRSYATTSFLGASISKADSRDWSSLASLGIAEASIDFVLTSPPYATALPYIDTDRLSLLVLGGLTASERRPLEEGVVGSREIRKADRHQLDSQIDDDKLSLPPSVGEFVRSLRHRMQDAEVGFRRANMPALLYRYFRDMAAVLSNVSRALKPGGEAFVIMGDNRTSDGESEIDIPTTEFVAVLAESAGLDRVEMMPITVTTESRVHIRHAIRDNAVIRLRKP